MNNNVKQSPIVLIIGDNGHGIKTSGKGTPHIEGIGTIKEHEFNQPTCNYFLQCMGSIGCHVFDVSPTDEDTSLKVRVQRANNIYQIYKDTYGENNVISIFVSFHFNAYNGIFDHKKGGVSTHYFPGAKDSENLANYIQTQIVKGTPQYDRGTKPDDFYVLRETNMTAVLIENGFMDKYSEAILMKNEKFQKEQANQTAEGCIQYIKEIFGVEMYKKSSIEMLYRNQQLEKEIKQYREKIEKLRNATKVLLNA